MGRNKRSFVLYLNYSEQFTMLDFEERGKLITAIFAHLADEELPELEGATKMAFSFMKLQLDRDSERYLSICKRNRENRLKGEKTKNAKLTSGHFGQPKVTNEDTRKTLVDENKFWCGDNDNEYDNVYN